MEAEGDGAITPTWTAVDSESVLTLSELWANLRELGWRVQVSHTPPPVLIDCSAIYTNPWKYHRQVSLRHVWPS